MKRTARRVIVERMLPIAGDEIRPGATANQKEVQVALEELVIERLRAGLDDPGRLVFAAAIEARVGTRPPKVKVVNFLLMS